MFPRLWAMIVVLPMSRKPSSGTKASPVWKAWKTALW